MIALICAVEAEADRLLEEIAASSTVKLGSKSVIEGTLYNQRVLLCVGGMGKVNASHAATLLLTRFNPEVLLVFGVGGAYPSRGRNRGRCRAREGRNRRRRRRADAEGFKDTEYIGIPLVKTATSEYLFHLSRSGAIGNAVTATAQVSSGTAGAKDTRRHLRHPLNLHRDHRARKGIGNTLSRPVRKHGGGRGGSGGGAAQRPLA